MNNISNNDFVNKANQPKTLYPNNTVNSQQIVNTLSSLGITSTSQLANVDPNATIQSILNNAGISVPTSGSNANVATVQGSVTQAIKDYSMDDYLTVLLNMQLNSINSQQDSIQNMMNTMNDGQKRIQSLNNIARVLREATQPGADGKGGLNPSDPKSTIDISKLTISLEDGSPPVNVVSYLKDLDIDIKNPKAIGQEGISGVQQSISDEVANLNNTGQTETIKLQNSIQKMNLAITLTTQLISAFGKGLEAVTSNIR